MKHSERAVRAVSIFLAITIVLFASCNQLPRVTDDEAVAVLGLIQGVFITEALQIAGGTEVADVTMETVESGFVLTFNGFNVKTLDPETPYTLLTGSVSSQAGIIEGDLTILGGPVQELQFRFDTNPENADSNTSFSANRRSYALPSGEAPESAASDS